MYTHNLNNNKIRILTWNILSEKLNNITDEWNIRVNKIVEIINENDPDIFCLQELDRFEDIKENFAENYISQFIPKHVRDNKDEMVDGCAMFVKKDKFKVNHIIDELIIPNTSQIFIYMCLQFINTNKLIHIVTTHLKAKSQFTKIRVNQINVLLKLFENVSDPCILCGDLNAFPHSQPLKICYDNNFRSSYSYDECDCTTFTVVAKNDNYTLKKTVDYILYKGNIVPISNVYFDNIDDIPTKDIPSDHVPLVTTFLF